MTLVIYDILWCVDCFFFFSSRRRHTRSDRDWSSDVCSSDLLLIDRREQPEVGAEGRAGEFDRRDWLDDTTCIDEILGHLKQLAPLQKERPLLRKEQRLPRIERELARVRLDLRKVRFDRAVEGEVVRDSPTDVAAHLRVSQIVLIAAGRRRTARPPGRLRIHVHDETAMHAAQADQVARLSD